MNYSFRDFKLGACALANPPADVLNLVTVGPVRSATGKVDATSDIFAAAATRDLLDGAGFGKMDALCDIEADLDLSGPVPGIIGQGEVTVLVGAPGCGKSNLAVALALSTAAAQPFMGYEVEQTAVLYLAAEGSKVIGNRLAAIRDHYQLKGQDVPLHRLAGQPDMLSEDAQTALIRRLVVMKNIYGLPVMLIIDTLSRVLAGHDENSSVTMAKLAAGLERIVAETGASIVVIHHPSKSDSENLRGHGALLGAIDNVIVAKAKTDGGCRAKVTKCRNGQMGTSLNFRLEQATLGYSKAGRAITASMALPVEEGAAEMCNPTVNLAPDQTAALEELKSLEASALANAADPKPGQHLVAVAEWKARLRQVMGRPDARLDTTRKAVTRAVEALVSAGYVLLSEDALYARTR